MENTATKIFSHNPESPKHPLWKLLVDSITAATGFGTSERLLKAWRVEGWKHRFEGHDGRYSIESISWENEAVFKQLSEIYTNQ
jgi:hypothetical protein